MRTYIFFWNPEVSDVTMSLFEKMLNVKGNGHFNWHIHDHEYVQHHDRVFVVKCGKGNTGICVSGEIMYNKYLDYFDSTPDHKVYNVMMSPSVMIHPDRCAILTTSELQKIIPDFDWSGGPSGRLLKKEDARKLEQIWKEFLNCHREQFNTKAFNFIQKPFGRTVQLLHKEMLVNINIGADGKFHLSHKFWDIEDDGEDDFKAEGTLEEVEELYRKKYANEANGRVIRFYYIWCEADYQDLCEKAIRIASVKHNGEKDYQGFPYLAHLGRIADWLNGGTLEKIVVYLKDTGCSADYLREQGFHEFMIDAVVALTKKKNESYKDYIMRLANNDIARKIKLLEVNERLYISSYDEMKSEDYSRLKEMHKAYNYLLNY